MAEEQTDMFGLDDELEQAEIERRLRETNEAEAQRKAENIAFQEKLRAQHGLPAAQPRGGARPGAGRKPNSPVAATKVMRVPAQYEAAVRALIAHLDDTAKLGRHYGPTTSEPVFVRSLYDKAQHVTFTVAPLKT